MAVVRGEGRNGSRGAAPQGGAVVAMVCAALLFGSTFAVVKGALADLDPASFVGWRFLLGGVLLLAVSRPSSWSTVRDGALAGAVLWAGFQLQTEGLVTTSATASGLITGLTVVLTPIFAATVVRRRPAPRVAVAAVVAFGGIALLTLRGFPGLPDTMMPSRGDLLTVGCAVAFAAHVLIVDRVSPRNPLVSLTAVQLLTVSMLSLGLATATGRLTAPPVAAWPELVATGIGVSAGAYLLQLWAQRHLGPTRTAVLLALEPVFAAAFGWVLLGERLTAAGWLGSALVLGAIALAISDGEGAPAAPAGGSSGADPASGGDPPSPGGPAPDPDFGPAGSCDTVSAVPNPGDVR